MKCKIGLAFVLLVVYSCNVSRGINQANNRSGKINLIGEYLCTPSNLYSSNITLNSDSSFKYEYIAGDLYTLISKGTWHLSFDQQYLILNSGFGSDSDLIKVDEEQVDTLKKINICVYDQNDQTFPFYLAINPTMENSHKQIAFDSDLIMGCHDFPMQKVKSLAITYLTIQANGKYLYYNIKNAEANRFIIHIARLEHPYRYFVNARWQIRKNRLCDLDTNYNKNCGVYQKQ